MKLRSARALILSASALLIALPLLLLGIAYGYETWLLRSEQRHLERLAASLDSSTDLHTAATAAHVSIRRLDQNGALREDSQTDALAVLQSPLSELVGKVTRAPISVSLQALEQSLEPLAQRAEVRAARGGQRAFASREVSSGLALLLTLAEPQPDGGVLLITQASRRGVRRLLLLRRELAQLAVYSTGAALLLALLLIRRLVRPLESLTVAARAYPAVPLAPPSLLARVDELGELSRAVTQMAADLDTRRRATAELGADIAHALKNPLAALRAAAELLSPSPPRELSEERRRFIATRVEESVEKLQRALDDLLHLLRIESELADEPRDRVEYQQLIEQVFAEYRRDPRFADWTLRAEVASEVGVVMLAVDRWGELLRNLIDNALIQPSSRRELVVSAQRTANAVITRVKDFGPGISAANLDKIFRRFFTHRPPGTPPGTGLGLSIVQSIAQAHGGRVTVSSQPGEGATFEITFPSS